MCFTYLHATALLGGAACDGVADEGVGEVAGHGGTTTGVTDQKDARACLDEVIAIAHDAGAVGAAREKTSGTWGHLDEVIAIAHDAGAAGAAREKTSGNWGHLDEVIAIAHDAGAAGAAREKTSGNWVHEPGATRAVRMRGWERVGGGRRFDWEGDPDGQGAETAASGEEERAHDEEGYEGSAVSEAG